MLINNTLWLLAEKLIKLLGAVVVSALIARHLQPEGFGVLNFYLAMLSIASVLSSLGLNRIIVREVANSIDSQQTANIVSTAFYLRLLASFIVFVIAVASSYYFVPQQHGYYAAIVFICLIFNASEIFDFYQQGMSSFKKVSKARLIAFALSVSFKLVLVLLEVELVWFLVANSFEYLLAGLLIYKSCSRLNYRSILSVGRFEFDRVKGLISESWPEIIAGFSAILFLKMDQMMLYYLANEHEVGIYAAAARLSEAWYFIPVAVISSTFPKLLELKALNNQNYLSGVRYLIHTLTFLALSAVFIATFLGGLAINLIYGTGFEASADALVIHTWGSIFLCLGLVSGSWLVAERKIKLNLYRNILGLIVNFFANLLLIPKYGAIGASWAMVLGLSSAYLFFNIFNIHLRWFLIEFFKTPLSVFDKSYIEFLRRQAKFKNNKEIK